MKTQADERLLDCNAGHDPCMCAGRLECHNCAAVLTDDYVKKPLEHDDYTYDHRKCGSDCSEANE